MKKVSVLLMALVMVLSMAIPALAADPEETYPTVTYVGGEEDFTFTNNDKTYTESDLFDNFKNVMPGDTLSQKIDVINAYTGSDYVKIYLQAVPHNEDNMPVAKGLENVDLAEMKDFLNQLTMTVTNMDNNQIIFEGQAGELDGIENAVLLGSFAHGDGTSLMVKLTVPESMQNEYANRMGEVDWKFIAEQYNYSNIPDDDDDDDTYKVTIKKVWKDGESKSRPEKIKVELTRNGKVYDIVTLTAKENWKEVIEVEHSKGWDVEEVNVPKGYEDSYSNKGRVFTITNTAELEQTGQLNWPIPVLAVAGLLLIGMGASLLRKGRNNA